MGDRLHPGADQPRHTAFRIRRVTGGRGSAAVSNQTLHSAPFYALRLFEPEALPPAAPRVLVVPPLSGHLPVLLRDMVLGLLKSNMRVAVLDWANVRHVPVARGDFCFDDNIGAIVRAILQLGPGAHVLALCQGGVPAFAASAELAARLPGSEPAGLMLLAAPVDPLANPTPLVELIRARPRTWYATVPLSRLRAGHAGHRRWVYRAETQLNALTRYLSTALETDSELARKMREDDGADPQHFPFRDLYSAVMDLDARLFVENLDHVFLRRDIARGTLRFRGRVIEPAALRNTMLVTVEGAEDEIAAPGQTSAAHALCPRLGPKDHHAIVLPGCGHFGLFHGRIWREDLCPTLAELITHRSAAGEPGR